MDFTDMAVAAWINLNALTHTYREVIAKGDDSASNTFEWGIRTTAADLWEFLFASGNNSFVADGPGIVAGVWTFVYVEFDSATKFGGIKVNNGGEVSAGTGGGLLNQTNQGLVIGSADNLPNFIDGKVGFFGFWNRKLTAGEQTTLFGIGDTVQYADLSGTLLNNLQVCYDFSGNQLNDKSGNANTLTNQNGVTFVTRP